MLTELNSKFFQDRNSAVQKCDSFGFAEAEDEGGMVNTLIRPKPFLPGICWSNKVVP
jgi:hypothetical protein